MKTKILNTYYYNYEFNFAIEKTLSLLKIKEKSSVFFLNFDCLYKIQNDAEYKYSLDSADIVLPDGIGLNIVTRIFGFRMKANCNGTDLSPLLMKEASKERYKIFFLGAKEGIAKKAAENVCKQIPGIQIVGTNSGYFSSDTEVIKKVNNSEADILFVAMGVPLQEKWIIQNRRELNPRLCLGVGALFDYLSGNTPRAPKIMIRLHLEWLWRIFIEPKRMFKRYVIDGAKLCWIILKYKLNELGLFPFNMRKL